MVRTVEQPYPQMTEIKPLKVAMYQRYYTGNADEGWTPPAAGTDGIFLHYCNG